MTQLDACPPDDELNQFLHGLLEDARRAPLREHLHACARCRTVAAQVVVADSRLQPSAADGELPSPDDPDGLLGRGALVGRYVVLELVGAGAMGVVYAAYDPELNRKVALKLVRTRLAGPTPQEARSRLLREAQALARLSHPSVIPVYDVGTLGEQVYLAMELVEGETLAQWMRSHRGNWRDVLALFIQAGRGLAAAHASGLVHRDFKPDNVLVGTDGRARVTDFGLARPVGEQVVHPQSSPEQPVGGLQASLTLTRTGTVLGTPGYMAPEQSQGRPATASADQYSFCVALYEALHGARPGEPLPAPLRGAPPWLRQAVQRGLRPEPGDRFESMEALLTVISRSSQRVWLRRSAFAVATVTALAALLAGTLAWSERAQRCSGGPAQLASAWGPEQASKVEQAFHATASPFAADAFGGVRRALDLYGASWVAMHEDACLATRARHEQSEAALDERMACLTRRLAGIEGLRLLLERADAQMLPRAVSAAQNLPSLAECADLESLTTRLRLPQDPAARAQVEAVRRQLAQVKALQDLGKFPLAKQVAQQAAEQARRTGHRPVEAEALLAFGRFQQAVGQSEPADQTLFEAIFAAQAAGHSEVEARGWIELMGMSKYSKGRPEDARRFAAHGRAVLERLGNNWELEALWQHQHGINLFDTLRFDEALAAHRQALSLREANHGPELHIAASLSRIGDTLLSQGKRAEGKAIYEKVLPIVARLSGPEHPNMAGTLTNMAVIANEMGDAAEALSLAMKAVGIFERALGAQHPRAALPIINAADALVTLGRPAEAIALYQRAIALREKADGLSHPSSISPLTGLGAALLALGKAADALAPLERAIELAEHKEAQDQQPGALAAFTLAKVLWETGKDKARAVALAGAARDGLERGGARDAGRLEQVNRWLANHPLQAGPADQ